MKKQLLALAVAAAGRWRRVRASQRHARQDQGQRHRSPWACANRPARCRYTLGDGKYVGFHVEMCRSIAGRHPEAARPGQARDQVPAGDLAEPHPAGAERHRRHRVRLDHQQRRAPEGRGVRRRPPTSRKCASRSRPTRASPRSRSSTARTVATTTGTTSVQTLRKNERAAGIDFKEVYRQGPRRQLPAARIGPRRRLRDGRPTPGLIYHEAMRTAVRNGLRETPEALSRRNCELMPGRLTGDTYDPAKAHPEAYQFINNFPMRWRSSPPTPGGGGFK